MERDRFLSLGVQGGFRAFRVLITAGKNADDDLTPITATLHGLLIGR